MSYICYFHSSVKQDYYEAYFWYEDKQDGLGEKFAISVRSKIQAILNHPENYGSTTNKKYRQAKVEIFPFIIVYQISMRRKEILIASIHHTRKHPRNKFRV